MKKGINASQVMGALEYEKKLCKMNATRERIAKVPSGEILYKDELESAGRLSYFTEVFEGISLEEQQIEINGFDKPKEAYFFNKGREIAERLAKNNIANMENYADFCKVETGVYRNGR